MASTELHPLGFFLPNHAKILLLGSFPPPKNRWSMNFYYPNIRNDMWRIMGLIDQLCRIYLEVHSGDGVGRFLVYEEIRHATACHILNFTISIYLLYNHMDIFHSSMLISKPELMNNVSFLYNVHYRINFKKKFLQHCSIGIFAVLYRR